MPEDDVEAVKWYRLAAEQGLADAQVNLGVMYDNGEGVPEDDAEAARWYRMAAEQGHSQAQLNVGIQYITGEGVAADPVQAYAWLDVAAAGGDPDAEGVRDSLAEAMTAEQIAAGEELARELEEGIGGVLARIVDIYPAGAIGRACTPASPAISSRSGGRPGPGRTTAAFPRSRKRGSCARRSAPSAPRRSPTPPASRRWRRSGQRARPDGAFHG